MQRVVGFMIDLSGEGQLSSRAVTARQKRAGAKPSTLWHLCHIQLSLQEHVNDLTIPKDARKDIEKASKAISDARVKLTSVRKS